MLSEIIIFVLGLSIGSFAYAFAFRYQSKRSWVRDRSSCEMCGRVLSWRELIPVFSFIIQGGRCRSCRKFIGWGYILSEIFMAFGFLFLWRSSVGPVLGYDVLIVNFFLLFLFFAIAVIDKRHFVIPDKLIILGIIAAILKFFFNDFYLYRNYLLTGLVLAAIFFLPWLISKGKYLGLGDVKLIFLIGILFGFPGALWITYLAAFIGVVLSVILLALKKANRKTPLPFGTFLSFSSIIYILFPNYIDSFFFAVIFYIMGAW